MAEPHADVARRAAARLADLDPRLPAFTERALAGHEEARTRSFDPATAIALAGLLVSMVQAGWSMWRDVKKDREEAARARAVVARRLRLAFPDPRGLSPADRDRMIEVVLDELGAPGAGGG